MVDNGRRRALVKCGSCRKWFTTADHPELEYVSCPRCGKRVKLRPPDRPGR